MKDFENVNLYTILILNQGLRYFEKTKKEVYFIHE